MPPLPSPGKVVRCDLFLVVGANQRVRDRIFFTYAGAGPAVADLTTLAATISAAWNTNITPQVNTGTTLFAITLTDLASSSGAQVSVSVARTGTLAGTPMSAGVALIVKFKINRRYRGGHPRFYLPGRVIGDLASSTAWNAGVLTAVSTAFAAFVAACVAGPPAALGAMAHANVSYFTGFTNRTFPSGRTRAVPNLRGAPLVDTIQSYSVNGLIGSQRRRNQQSA
jgi:hypothetical protein